ncbi:hypothetical protein PALI_a1799 [Pseudoalteromonas aliena SW19]|uniref:Transposase n=1 Tax=Pseudoalteromonas aliena SW19 TaxID=1314866 RepID=A0ABR9DY59_9GAMM|nr:hypothetical protein [Pseudoalteromonas aliena SW19]
MAKQYASELSVANKVRYQGVLLAQKSRNTSTFKNPLVDF